MTTLKCPECGKEFSNSEQACPNCGCPASNCSPAENNNIEVQQDFNQKLVSVIGYFFYRLIYFIFVLPFDLWKKAVVRLYNQRERHMLDANTIHHEVPFFVWLKRFFFDFVLDGIAAMGWFIGALFAIIMAIKTKSAEWLLLIFCVYYIPVSMAITRDHLTLMVVLPIRWLLTFYRRPAKTYDFTHSGNIKKN